MACQRGHNVLSLRRVPSAVRLHILADNTYIARVLQELADQPVVRIEGSAGVLTIPACSTVHTRACPISGSALFPGDATRSVMAQHNGSRRGSAEQGAARHSARRQSLFPIRRLAQMGLQTPVPIPRILTGSRGIGNGLWHGVVWL